MMGDKSKIEWTDASWNPIRARNKETGGVGHFCIHVSEGCRNCYAERMQKRFGNPARYVAQHRDKVELFLDEKAVAQPRRWRKPRRIFVCSMTDLFADFVPDEWIDKIFAVMALTPHHTYQILTKRPDRMSAYLSRANIIEHLGHVVTSLVADGICGSMAAREVLWSGKRAGGEDNLYGPMRDYGEWPFPNVWLGTSAEDPNSLDRIDYLQQTPAALRFLSLEPLLAPLDIEHCLSTHWICLDCGDGQGWEEERFCHCGGVYTEFPAIDWVIVGGESGPNARPMHPDWARSLRDQCVNAGVAYFFKQWGQWTPVCAQYPATDDEHDEAERAGLCADICMSNNGYIWPDDHQPAVTGRPWLFDRVGKKRAGRMLDGRTWDEYPEVGNERS